MPDLILLEVMMLRMDGREAWRRLKFDPQTAEISVICVAAMPCPADDACGLALGSMEYLSKPFSPAVVLPRVRTPPNSSALRQ